MPSSGPVHAPTPKVGGRSSIRSDGWQFGLLGGAVPADEITLIRLSQRGSGRGNVSEQTHVPAPTEPARVRRSWLGRAWEGLLTALLLMLVGLYGVVYLIVVVFGLIVMFMWFLRFWGWT